MEFNQAFNISRGLEHGWAALKRVPLPLFLGALFMQCTEGSGGGNNSGSSNWGGGSSGGGLDYDYLIDPMLFSPLRADVPPLDPSGFGDAGMLAGMGGMLIAVVLGAMVCLGLIWVLRSWIHGGYIRVQTRALRSGEGTVGELFSATDRIVPMMLWKLLKALVSTGVLAVSMVPGGALFGIGYTQDSTALMVVGGVLAVLIALPAAFYVGLGLVFGEHAVILDELSPTEALERSWGLADGNRMHLFGFLLVYWLVEIAALIVGLLMLCIGVLVTAPAARAVTDLGFTEGYLLLTGKAGLDDMAGVFD